MPNHYLKQCWLNIKEALWHLTHWDRVTHICVSKLTTICSYNGLLPGQRQALIWANAGILLIWPSQTNFSEILIKIQTFSFKKIHLKMSSTKWRPFCLSLNELTESDFTENVPDITPYKVIATYTFENTGTSPRGQWVNSLWPSDAIWRQRSGWTLVQLMACCLTAPSHYLKHCWLIISKVQWYPSESNFTRDTSAINHWNYLEN